MYDNKFKKFPCKFQIHLLGSYVIKNISDVGTVQLAKLNGKIFPSRINEKLLVLLAIERKHRTINYSAKEKNYHKRKVARCFGRSHRWKMR